LKAREEEDKKDEGKQDDKPADKKAADKKPSDKKPEGKDAGKKDEPAAKPLVVEAEGLDERVARLSTVSGDIRDYVLTPDGEQLFYVTKV
ncbi:hypothetical protein, partial [Enterobacter hormaechei]